MGTNTYQYDANGNMTQRVVNGQTYNLGYDAEGRMVSVGGPSLEADFVYDGDGSRVQSTINNVTTSFVGNYYEVTGTAVTKYYFAGAQRVAMRVGAANPFYMLSDHLGSTTVTTDSSGGLISELRYKPWGEVRSGSAATKYTYTGQYSNVSDFGLLFYNARWFDPYLSRWTQPDTIVPDALNPQALDRYAYTLNNPVRYTDPSGHCTEVEEGLCVHEGKGKNVVHVGRPFRDRFSTEFHAAIGAFIVTGDSAALDRYPYSPSWAPAFVGAATEDACTALSRDCGHYYQMVVFVMASGAAAMGGAYPPVGVGPGSGGSSPPRGGIYGDPDCPGCGFRLTAEEILKPGGKPVWTVTGGNPAIGTMATEPDLLGIFRALSVEGTPANRPGFKGPQYDLPGGGWVGLRESADFGTTIELDIPGWDLHTLHLPFR